MSKGPEIRSQVAKTGPRWKEIRDSIAIQFETMVQLIITNSTKSTLQLNCHYFQLLRFTCSWKKVTMAFCEISNKNHTPYIFLPPKKTQICTKKNSFFPIRFTRWNRDFPPPVLEGLVEVLLTRDVQGDQGSIWHKNHLLDASTGWGHVRGLRFSVFFFFVFQNPGKSYVMFRKG